MELISKARAFNARIRDSASTYCTATVTLMWAGLLKARLHYVTLLCSANSISLTLYVFSLLESIQYLRKHRVHDSVNSP